MSTKIMKLLLCATVITCSIFSPLSAGLFSSADDLSRHPVRFAIIGDRTGGHVEGVYGQVVEEIERLKPDFIMTVGDQIEGYSQDLPKVAAEWDEYMKIIEPFSSPVHFTPGNHDITFDAMESVYRDYIGEPYHSFNHRGIHFVILDNSRFESPSDWDETQLKWLKKDLKKNKKAAYTFVFYHKPFWYNTIAAGRPNPLHEIFVEYGVDAVFNGHFHQYFSGEYDGVKYTSIGSSGAGATEDPTGLKYHFAWVTVDNQGFNIFPVKQNAVLPWDQMTADDLHQISEIYTSGISINNPLLLDKKLNLAQSKFTVHIENILNDVEMTDTISWDLPEGWSIEPSELEISIEAGKGMDLEFEATCSDLAVEPPVMMIDFPYAPGKTTEIKYPILLTRSVTAKDIKGSILGGFGDLEQYYFNPGGGLTDIEKVAFFFLHDDENLIIHTMCEESDMSKLAVSTTERDGPVYGEDCVGFFIQPDREQDVVYQIYFNPNGVVFDQKIVKTESGQLDADREWNGSYEVKTDQQQNYWAMEIKIPFSELEIEGEPQNEWGINFRRKQARLKSSADWIIPISYDPGTYGTLILE